MAIPIGQSIPPRVSFLEDFTEGHIIDQLRLYDDQIYKWLSTFEFPEGPPNFSTLFIVFASPEKGYGETRNLTNRDRRESDRTRDPVVKPKLPAASIMRGSPVKDYERWHRSEVSKAGYVDENKEELYQVPYPDPWDIPYQIEVTTINRTTLNFIQQWLMLQFDDNKFWIAVDPGGINRIAYPTEYVIPVELDSFTDTSDLEPGEEPRLMRLTLDVTVKGWLFRPARRVKTVHHIDYEVYDGDPETGTFLESFDP